MSHSWRGLSFACGLVFFLVKGFFVLPEGFVRRGGIFASTVFVLPAKGFLFREETLCLQRISVPKTRTLLTTRCLLFSNIYSCSFSLPLLFC